MSRLFLVALGVPLALAACTAVPPPGPSTMVLPAKGKSFDQFQQENATCKQFAAQETGYKTPAQASQQSGVGSALAGAGVGAAAGAAIGAAAGNPLAGAAIGAGSGLLVGSAAGIGNAQLSSDELQRRYDIAYQQCMYAEGNQLPGSQPVKAHSQGQGSFYPAVPAYPAYPVYPAYPPYPRYYYYPPYYYYPGPVVSLHFGGRHWHHHW
jgi:outer membrane lipoprotein SlyB